MCFAGLVSRFLNFIIIIKRSGKSMGEAIQSTFQGINEKSKAFFIITVKALLSV